MELENIVVVDGVAGVVVVVDVDVRVVQNAGQTFAVVVVAGVVVAGVVVVGVVVVGNVVVAGEAGHMDSNMMGKREDNMGIQGTY